MYLNRSSYYYDHKESILYQVRHGYSKYNRRYIFSTIHDNKLLKYNNIVL
jgi:hypothetical protein